MSTLTSFQRKFLRCQSHSLDAHVMVGKQGVTDAVLQSVNEALEANELIKIRFIDHKDEKKALTEQVAATAPCDIAGIIGHVAILYRQNPDETKRCIEFPAPSKTKKKGY